MTFLKPGERIDDLQRSQLGIIQNPAHFCFGTDAVLLSGFVRAGGKERVVDLCTGNGIIPLLLSAKTRAKEITGVEIQAEIADMARRSVAMNGLEERVRILHGDLREGIAGASGSVDVVSCNPPYMALRRGEKSQATSRAIARQEICCSLEEAVNETARLLKNGGRAYFVYRPHRLDELFAACNAVRLTPKRMKFAHPYSEREANLVLLEAVKGGGSFLRVEAPIIVFRSPGVYSDEIRDIYGY